MKGRKYYHQMAGLFLSTVILMTVLAGCKERATSTKNAQSTPEDYLSRSVLISARDGIYSLDLSTGQRSRFSSETGPIERHDNRIYIFLRGRRLIHVMSTEGKILKSIQLPIEVTYGIDFGVLPDGRIAISDNKNDKVYFLDQSGKHLKTVELKEKSSGRLQNMHLTLAKDKLLVSENGFKEIVQIDTSSYEASILRRLAELRPWLGAIDYDKGRYYICNSKSVHSFAGDSEDVKLIATVPQNNITGIKIVGEEALVIVNGRMVSSGETRKYSGALYRVDLKTGEVATIIEELARPEDIEILVVKTDNDTIAYDLRKVAEDKGEKPGPQQPDANTPRAGAFSESTEVRLAPNTPDSNHRLNWSPYGKRHKLIQAGNGLETEIYLGPEGLRPISARLEKSSGSEDYDILKVDGNRNGSFEKEEVLETTPRIRREKIWSSFKTIVDIPVTNPWTGDSIINPYPMSLWYVEDPREEDQEKLLRFTREWWLEGNAKLDGIDCLILVSEMRMDGIIDENDRWALAPANEAQAVYVSKNNRSVAQYAWLGDYAYRITEIHPSGRKLTIEPYDPDITKEEDLKRRDPYSEDREVPRSGKKVAFIHDFKEAEALARKEDKPLFVKFETTWCGPCKVMDQLVYTADVVVKAAQDVISVKVDTDEQAELKKQFRVSGHPTMVLLTPQGEELKRTSGYRGVKEMAVFLNLNLLTTKCEIPEENLRIPEDMQACAANLQQIYKAIKEYEKDKGKLPDWLSDLVPDYLNSKQLLCPSDNSQKTGFPSDPRLPCSYGWQFSSKPIPKTWDATGRTLYRDWKTKQVKLFGEVVPMVRCYHHGSNKVLNLSVSGQIWQGTPIWEPMFRSDYASIHKQMLSEIRTLQPTDKHPKTTHDSHIEDASGTKLLKGTYSWDIDSNTDGVKQAADIFWRQVSKTERYLVPINGSLIGIIKDKTFEKLNLGDLEKASLANIRISASDARPDIDSGTVLAIQTSEGNLAKLEVIGFNPLNSSNPKYNMKLRYVLYRK